MSEKLSDGGLQAPSLDTSNALHQAAERGQAATDRYADTLWGGYTGDVC